MKNYYFTTIIILSIALSVLPHTSRISAQIGASDAETINVKPAHQFYEPNSSIKIEVLSRIINLNNKQITWTVNGNVVQTGYGIKSITVPTGTQTNPTTVRFEAILPTQGKVTRKLTLRPVEVDLIWESDQSYIPPFYLGKALNPGWGKMSVTAIPHIYKPNGRKYKKENLIYKWEYNGIVYGDDSGRGKNTITVNTTPRENRMSLEIEAPNGNKIARDFINFPRTEPRIVFYKQSSLIGTVFRNSLEDSDELDKNVDDGITAFPYYYLADNSKANNLEYQWSINGSEVGEQSFSKNTISVDGIRGGSVSFSLEVSDNNQLLFPSHENNININLD